MPEGSSPFLSGQAASIGASWRRRLRPMQQFRLFSPTKSASDGSRLNDARDPPPAQGHCCNCSHPVGVAVAAAFALLYVFNPFDLMPDVLPFIGALDDAAVVGACLMLIERDLRQYRSWKENQLMLNEPKG